MVGYLLMTFILKAAFYFLIDFFHDFLTTYKGYIFSNLKEGIYARIKITTLSCKPCWNFLERRLSGHIITS